MSHHAQIDENNIVTQIIVTSDDPDVENWLVETFGGVWKKTSYNTFGNIHYGPDKKPDGGTPLRYNYAIIGGHYDPEADAFYFPSPYPSWILDKTKFTWVAPIPKTPDVVCSWNEETQSWVSIPSPYPSWICVDNAWQAPIPRPTDGSYLWDEESQSWYLAHPLAKENNV